MKAETETLTIGKAKYQVDFSRYNAVHPRLRKQRNTTVAEIYDSKETWIGSGEAYRNPTDPANPKIGRAVAFKKAVAHLPYKKRVRLLQAFFSATKTAPSINAPIN